MAMKNRLPARFPKKETNQFFATSMTVTLRCRNAVHERAVSEGELLGMERPYHEHDVAREQVSAGKYDHHESNGKH